MFELRHIAALQLFADKLAQSDQARACVARQWFRYVMERFEQEADGCTMTALMNDFSASEYRLASLRTSIVKTEAFRSRRPIVLATARSWPATRRDQAHAAIR